MHDDGFILGDGVRELLLMWDLPNELKKLLMMAQTKWLLQSQINK
jgi:hypothetical protein